MNIYDLERLVKNKPLEVYNHFVELVENKRYKEAINYVKRAGILQSKNYNLIMAIDVMMSKIIVKEVEFMEFTKQYKMISYLNKVHSDTEKSKIKELDEYIQKNKQAITLLNSAAFFIKGNPYKLSKSEKQKYFDYNENIVSSISTVLKIFLYQNNEFVYSAIVDKEDINKINMMVNFATTDICMKTLNDIWRFSEIMLKIYDDKVVVYEQGELGKSLRISQTNFLDIRDATNYKQYLEYRFNHDNYNYERVKMNIVKDFIREYFYTEDLKQEYDNVKLKDWINAYCEIVKFGNDNLRYPVVIRAKKEWQLLFTKIGIDEDSANKIIDSLIFTTKSKDLFDCPFVAFDCGIVLVPTIAAIIDPSRSLLSLLSDNSKKHTKINQKGSNFEKKLKKILSDCGIYAIGMKEHDYELDLVFRIDDDLFLVEAKTLNQPTNHWEYARYQDEINRYIKKFKRNYSYFCQKEKIKNIKKKMKMNTINNIYKVFVSNILDIRSKINGIYITNDTVFEGYFLRKEPSGYVIQANTMIKTPLFITDAYKGKYSGNQFIKLIEDNLFTTKNAKRVIHEPYRLPYYYQTENNKELYFEVSRYGFKTVDEFDLLPD